MGMDIKVLAAVFITLFGIAVGMADGDLTVDDLSDLDTVKERFDKSMKKIEKGGDIFDGIDTGKEIFETGEPPNTSITASFTTSSATDSITLDRGATVTFRGDTRLTINDLTTSEEDFEGSISGFTGRVSVGTNTSIEGSATALSFSSLSFNTSEPKDVSVDIDAPEFVRISGIERKPLRFERVNGSFSVDGTTVSVQNDSVSLGSFSGEVSYDPAGDRFSLDGRVADARVGAANLG